MEKHRRGMFSCTVNSDPLKIQKSKHQKNAHKFSVFAGDQDVHLGALGADDLAFQRIAAQVHVATVRLVDGDCGDLPHDLGG